MNLTVHTMMTSVAAAFMGVTSVVSFYRSFQYPKGKEKNINLVVAVVTALGAIFLLLLAIRRVIEGT